MDLRNTILGYLKTKSLTNFEIREKINSEYGEIYSKTEVNRLLYKLCNEKRVKRTKLNPPKWSLIETSILDVRGITRFLGFSS